MFIRLKISVALNVANLLFFCGPTAVCFKGCMHGKCVGADRCRCNDGWEGKTCDKSMPTKKKHKLKTRAQLFKVDLFSANPGLYF